MNNMNEMKNICIYGIGGIGGSVGGLFCNNLTKLPGIQVSFIARGNHLNTIQENGLNLRLPNNEVINCRPFKATSSIEQISPPDLILLAVKAYDLLNAAQEISKVMKPDTIVIPLLNGFDIYERLREIIKIGYIFPTSVIFGGRKLNDGECFLYMPGPVFYGTDPLQKEYVPNVLIQQLTIAFKNSPVKFNWVQNPYPIIWQKYMANVAMNLVGAYSGKVYGEIFKDASLKQLVINILKETAEIIKKKNIPLPPTIVENVLDAVLKFPFSTKSSYAVDIETKALNNEGEIFGTAIINLGKKMNVKTQTIEFIFNEIQQNNKNQN
jgi:2-dehydropantoate 2-reductase